MMVLGELSLPRPSLILKLFAGRETACLRVQNVYTAIRPHLFNSNLFPVHRPHPCQAKLLLTFNGPRRHIASRGGTFLQQDTFFEKLSRQFACKTDTTVGHYRWFG